MCRTTNTNDYRQNQFNLLSYNNRYAAEDGPQTYLPGSEGYYDRIFAKMALFLKVYMVSVIRHVIVHLIR